MKRTLIILAALVALYPLVDAIAHGTGRGGRGHGGGGMGQRPPAIRYQDAPDALIVNPEFPWTAHWGSSAGEEGR
jgi:hypothetical protein